MADVPFVTGKGAALTLWFGQSTLAEFLVPGWEIEEMGEAITDDICGEDRSRFDWETSGYRLSINAPNVTMAKLDTILKARQDADDFKTPEALTLGFVIRPKNGTKTAYTLSEGVLDGWRFGFASRTARGLLVMPMRFRYCKPVTI